MKQAFSVDGVCGRDEAERRGMMKEVKAILDRHGYVFIYYPPKGDAHSIIIIERKVYEKQDKG